MEKGGSSSVLKKSWADLISNPKDDLKFIDIPDSARQGDAIRLPKEVLDKGVERLKAVVVVQFLGNPPPFRVFVNVANRLWGYEGSVIIASLEANFFMIEFNSVKLCDWVLSRSWHAHNTGMIMRKWARGIRPVVIPDGQCPEWITFQRVPPAAISQEGISWLSSLIGKPVRNFVRDGLDIKVCIIRDKAIPCPESLKILDEDEQHIIQVIQAKARIYTNKTFDRQVYRPKVVRVEPEVKSDHGTTSPEVVVATLIYPEKEVQTQSSPVIQMEPSSKGQDEGSGGKKTKKRRKNAKRKLLAEAAEANNEMKSAETEQVLEVGTDPVPSHEGIGSPVGEEVQMTAGTVEGPKPSQLSVLPEDLRLRDGEISKWTSEEESEVIHTVRKFNLGDFMQHAKHVQKKYQVSGVKTRYKTSIR
ncbi:hypothetical protein LINPERPRIM_LOCUS20323 [Linum perenne]